MRAVLTCLSAAAFLLVAAGPARAQAPGMTPPGTASSLLAEPSAGTTIVTTRYGWQIALADVSALSLAVGLDSGTIFAAGYLGGGPAIHLAHGNPGRALTSAGLRLGLPYLGAALAVGLSDCSNSHSFCLGEMVVGAMLGMGTAVVIDYVVLARTERPLEREPAALLRLGSLRANPTLAASERGLALGFAGHF